MMDKISTLVQTAESDVQTDLGKMFGRSKSKTQKTGAGATDDASSYEKRIRNIFKGIDDALSKNSSAAAEDEEEQDIKPVCPTSTSTYSPTYIKNLPTSSMTNGIEEYYIKLCATISALMYSSQPEGTDQFGILDTDYKAAGLDEPPKVLLYDEQFKATNPPFSVTVAGKKMILAWRGSYSVMDWVRDFGFYPASSFRWKNVVDVVRVQGSYLACVESKLSTHQDFILQKIKEHGITEMLLTGHSLGGGVAQVAQLWFTGTMDSSIDPQPNPWKDLKDEVGLTVHTISFEGPMTTAFVKSGDDALNKKGIDFLNKCSANMCTTCYSMDVVPRLPGYLDFGLSMLENLPSDVENSEHGLIGKCEKFALNHFLHSSQACSIRDAIHVVLMGDIEVAIQFQHLGHILFYDSPEAEPKVYIDDPNSILADAEGTTSQLPQFRDIKYQPAQTPADVVNNLLLYHNYVIFGPGLSLNWEPWFEKFLVLREFIEKEKEDVEMEASSMSQ